MRETSLDFYGSVGWSNVLYA